MGLITTHVVSTTQVAALGRRAVGAGQSKLQHGCLLSPVRRRPVTVAEWRLCAFARYVQTEGLVLGGSRQWSLERHLHESS